MENNSKLDKLTINKINEYPQDFSIMSIEEQMTAKGGLIFTATAMLIIGGVKVGAKVFAGKTGGAALGKAAKWVTAQQAGALLMTGGADLGIAGTLVLQHCSGPQYMYLIPPDSPAPQHFTWDSYSGGWNPNSPYG